MNIHDSIVGIHNAVMDISNLKYHNHVHYSIMAVHNSKLWNPSLNLRISIIVNGWSEIWMYGKAKSSDYGHPCLIVNTHDSIVGIHNSEMWMYGKAKSSDYGHPCLIMNTHDSIVGIHNSVMDIRNLIFIFLNYHVYP